MKKECAQTRRVLGRYLRGHVFAIERKRIERHLRICPLCATEYQSIKRADETTQFLKDITPAEGVVQKVREGVSSLSGVRKILYRPLWVLAAVMAGYLLAQYVVRPYLQEQERAWRELTSPAEPGPAPRPVPAPPGTTSPPAPKPAEPPQVPPMAEKSVDPLVVTITAEDEQAAIRRINEVMRGHGVLRVKRLSDTVREIEGELTPKELLTFMSRIETAGKIGYNRRRFEEFPNTQPLPFILRVKAAPGPPAAPAEMPLRQATEAPTMRPNDHAPAQAAEPSAPKPAPESPQAR